MWFLLRLKSILEGICMLKHDHFILFHCNINPQTCFTITMPLKQSEPQDWTARTRVLPWLQPRKTPLRWTGPSTAPQAFLPSPHWCSCCWTGSKKSYSHASKSTGKDFNQVFNQVFNQILLLAIHYMFGTLTRWYNVHISSIDVEHNTILVLSDPKKLCFQYTTEGLPLRKSSLN